MSFSVMDRVVVLTKYVKGARGEQLGAVHLVKEVDGDLLITKNAEGDFCFVRSSDVRLATEDELDVCFDKHCCCHRDLKRGDLVEFLGEVAIVVHDGKDADGYYHVYMLTDGDQQQMLARDYELSYLGSIRKKLKRLKKTAEKLCTVR